MFFLLRTAFWLSIVLVLLPTPESVKTEPGVGAAQAVTAASATFSDMSQFCTRQPGACEVGSPSPRAVRTQGAGEREVAVREVRLLHAGAGTRADRFRQREDRCAERRFPEHPDAGRYGAGVARQREGAAAGRRTARAVSGPFFGLYPVAARAYMAGVQRRKPHVCGDD